MTVGEGPKNGTQTNPMVAAISTSLSRSLRLELEHLGAVGQHEGDEDVERRLLRQPHESRGQDLARLVRITSSSGCLTTFSCYDRRKLGALQDPQSHVEADADQHQADQERDAPAPGVEVGAGEAVVNRPRRSRGPGRAGRRAAASWPSGRARCASPIPSTAGRSRPTRRRRRCLARPAAGSAGSVPRCRWWRGRQQADEERRDAHQQQGGDQRGLASDPVAEVAEDRRADGPGREADELVPNESRMPVKAACREEQRREDQRGGGAVQEEVVPLDAWCRRCWRRPPAAAGCAPGGSSRWGAAAPVELGHPMPPRGRRPSRGHEGRSAPPGWLPLRSNQPNRGEGRIFVCKSTSSGLPA